MTVDNAKTVAYIVRDMRNNVAVPVKYYSKIDAIAAARDLCWISGPNSHKAFAVYSDGQEKELQHQDRVL